MNYYKYNQSNVNYVSKNLGQENKRNLQSESDGMILQQIVSTQQQYPTPEVRENKHIPESYYNKNKKTLINYLKIN